MAPIIPSTPLSSLPIEVLKTYRFFRSLPDDYMIWHHLTPWEPEAPDFLIVNRKKQALLVKVSSAAKSVHSPAQMLLLGEARFFGEQEQHVIEVFKSKIPAPIKEQVSAAIFFPNVRPNTLENSNNATRKYHWVGQEVLQNNTGECLDALFTGEGLNNLMLEKLRSLFTPEIVIPAALTVRAPDTGRHAAGLNDYLLDILQESAVKNDLELPVEQQKASNDFRVWIINGVAGSGKTLILLYRLRLLHARFPNQKFLVLTHNRPLIRDIQSRYQLLSGDLPKNISWNTFNGFCRRFWPEKDTPWLAPAGQAEREHLIENVREQLLKDTSIQPDSLLSEIDWFKDQLPMDKTKYLQAERKGRGFRLNQDQRIRMWEAMAQYQAQLRMKSKIDWADVPRRMWNFIREKKVQLPEYDCVMIDEAQFFAPIWFDIIRQIIKPRSGHLFIVADPTQGFLGRGTSWKSLGIDARGKTQNIRRSYRTTHEILNFATLLYRKRIEKEDSEEDIVVPDLMNMPHGLLPILIPLRSGQDEIGRVTAEVEDLKKRGAALQSILILHTEWEGVNSLIASINNRLGENTAVDPKDSSPGNSIRVTTLNAGTGLESPVVFLVGLNRLFEREQSLRLADDDIDRLILENTRKVYMAATRAGQRLIITYVGNIPEVLKDLMTKTAD
jgi:superfamily I DNA/RNA helicase